jgi:hypothetical protein
MTYVRALRLLLPALVLGRLAGAQDPAALATEFADGVRQVNEAHAKAPGNDKEKDLAKKLPAGARAAVEKLLKVDKGAGLADALLKAGEAALDLDLADDFARIRKRAPAVAPDALPRLGIAVSRARFVARGLGGLEDAGLERFADVADAVLDAYDKVFGFAEWSKVPGKKLRFRVRLVDKITAPPHFGPEFPFHSEVDFPVVDAKGLASPTADGKFLFYGLCHELGHVIAMWGDAKNEEDHHAWAHYTGVAIVEWLGKHEDPRAPAKDLKDAQWRSIEKERAAAAKTAPSPDSKEGVMALLVALHDKAGPKAIGDAINLLDRKDKRLRINRVLYYSFAELKSALLEVCKSPDARAAIAKLLP